MSVGMITTSMLVATRWQPARRGRALALATGSAMGTGLVALGLSETTCSRCSSVSVGDSPEASQ